MKHTRTAAVGLLAVSIATLAPSAVASAADTTPPSLTVPAYPAFVVGSQIGTSSAPEVPGEIDLGVFTSGIQEKVTWSASDASGICGYDADAEYAGSEPTPLLINSPNTSYTVSTTDYDDEFGGGSFKLTDVLVTAHDCAGNTRSKYSLVSPHVIQEDGFSPNGHATLTYTGTWTTSNFTGFSGGHTRKTTASGAAVTIGLDVTFAGQHAALVMEKAPDRGKAKIYVDGVLKTTIDTYSATTKHRVVVYDVKLSPGHHTIKIVNSATAGRPRIDLDAILTNGV